MSESCVSVVIPTHNRAAYIKTAVASALAQKGVITDVIVVDDMSTDDTSERLLQFGATIRLTRTGANIERGAARNLGARLARCGLIAFLDSDDSWEADKLASQIPLVTPKQACVCGIRLVDAADRPMGSPYVPPVDALADLTVENKFLAAPSSIVLPRSMFLQVAGFPEAREVQGSEDWLFLLRLRRAGFDIAVIDQPLVRYRVHAGNSIANPDAVANSMWSAVAYMKEHALLKEQDLWRTRGHTAGVIGRQFAARGNPCAAAKWAFLAYREGSLAIGARASIGIVLSLGKRLLMRSLRKSDKAFPKT